MDFLVEKSYERYREAIIKCNEEEIRAKNNANTFTSLLILLMVIIFFGSVINKYKEVEEEINRAKIEAKK
jgi:hypothetical protein